MIPGSENYVALYRATTINATGEPFAPANPERVGLVLWLNGGGVTLFVWPGSIIPPGMAIQLPAEGTLEFWWARHGPMVQDSWSMVIPPGPYTFYWIELLYKK